MVIIKKHKRERETQHWSVVFISVLKLHKTWLLNGMVIEQVLTKGSSETAVLSTLSMNLKQMDIKQQKSATANQ